jgi:hypothetical protein
MICNHCRQSVYLVQSTQSHPTALSMEEGAELLTYGLVGHDLELAAYARLWGDGRLFLVDHKGRRYCPARPRENRRF